MKQSILIVDDEELNRELLKQIFEDDYNIILAKDGKEAINLLSRHYKDIVVILLDLIMPVVNGYQVLQVLNSKGMFKEIPVILVTANADSKGELFCYSLGAAAFIYKPFDVKVVRKIVDNVIEMYLHSEELKNSLKNKEEMLHEQQKKLNTFYDKLMEVVSNIVEFRNLESGMHIKRVKDLTRIIAENYMRLYPESGLTPEKIEVIVRASAIHDIGKIAIPDNILLKPGRLTPEEREVMKSHTTKGCEILNLLADIQDDEQYAVSYEICRHHHERYDGNGYPDKLVGDEIALPAQLVSIVDVYDALVNERVYKKAYDEETAYKMIVNGECGIFSPKLLQCFEHARSQIERYAETYQEDDIW